MKINNISPFHNDIYLFMICNKNVLPSTCCLHWQLVNKAFAIKEGQGYVGTNSKFTQMAFHLIQSFYATKHMALSLEINNHVKQTRKLRRILHHTKYSQAMARFINKHGPHAHFKIIRSSQNKTTPSVQIIDQIGYLLKNSLWHSINVLVLMVDCW